MNFGFWILETSTDTLEIQSQIGIEVKAKVEIVFRFSSISRNCYNDEITFSWNFEAVRFVWIIDVWFSILLYKTKQLRNSNQFNNFHPISVVQPITQFDAN